MFPVADPRGGPPPSGTLAYADTGIYDLVWSRNHPPVALGTQGRLVRLLPAGFQYIKRRNGTLFRLEENIQGPVTGLTACTH